MNELRMCRGTWSFCDGNCDKCRTIATASTIDVREVKRGEWVHDGSDWKYRFLCSVCGYKLMGENPTNYCPNCGADMKEDE